MSPLYYTLYRLEKLCRRALWFLCCLTDISSRVHSHGMTTAVQNSELASCNHCDVFWTCHIHCLGTKTVIHPTENIDCLSSLSFTGFSLSSLSFSDCFLCFCFSCLWYLPSSSSSGLPQPSHGCPECKVVWCWSLLFVGVMFFFLWIMSPKWFSILLLWPLLFVQLSALFHGV